LKGKQIEVDQHARAQLFATEILIGSCQAIEKCCFYALTDFFFFQRRRSEEARRRRQGVTSSGVKCIYPTFPSLMLLNSNRTSLPSKPKRSFLFAKILADRAQEAQALLQHQALFEHQRFWWINATVSVFTHKGIFSFEPISVLHKEREVHGSMIASVCLVTSEPTTAFIKFSMNITPLGATPRS
jgi:hypothetical protein